MNVPILGESKRRILVELRKDGIHGYELASRLKISVTGIYQLLKELSDEQLIESMPSGRRKVYRLTEKGRKLVEVLES